MTHTITKPAFEKYCLFDEKKELETITVTIMLTNKCTHQCWYCSCHSKTKKGKKIKESFITPENFNKILSFIKIQNRKYTKIILTGGEPTIHPNLKDFIKKIKDTIKKVSIQLNTNLSQSLDFYKKLNLKDFEINISFHSEYIQDISKWFEKVQYLEKYNTTRVYLMLEKNNLDLIKNIKEKYFYIKEMSIRPIFEFRNTSQCEKIDWVEDNHIKHQSLEKKEIKNIQVIPLRENWENWRNFYGMMCSAELIILVTGDCWYCWQEVWRKKPILNIFNDKPYKIPRFHLCTDKVCNDGFYFPKYSTSYYLKNIGKK